MIHLLGNANIMPIYLKGESAVFGILAIVGRLTNNQQSFWKMC